MKIMSMLKELGVNLKIKTMGDYHNLYLKAICFVVSRCVWRV